MFQRMDHLGVAVKSLDQAAVLYGQVLGLPLVSREEVPSQQVRVACYRIGEMEVELLEPLSGEGPIARFLASHGEGIHHVAFRTDDIVAALQRARNAGYQLIHETPVPGAGGRLAAFLHPRSTHGVLMEFCQSSGGSRAS